MFNEWGGIATELNIPDYVKKLDYKEHRGKRLEFIKSVKEKIGEEKVNRFQQLERLQRLDWQQFIENTPHDILENAIIYCDPPYKNTAAYAENTFSHKEFWQWFRETPYCVYVSSSEAPPYIHPICF